MHIKPLEKKRVSYGSDVEGIIKFAEREIRGLICKYAHRNYAECNETVV